MNRSKKPKPDAYGNDEQFGSYMKQNRLKMIAVVIVLIVVTFMAIFI